MTDPTRELAALADLVFYGDMDSEASMLSARKIAAHILAAGWSPPADANAPGLREAVEALADEFWSHRTVDFSGRFIAGRIRALATQPDKAEGEA